jgi:argininosuccinate lyase
MGNLSRAAADLLEWSSVEFAYVEVADEYASSSSTSSYTCFCRR